MSSSRREDPCRSNHSICSASSSQPRATSSNAPFMDGLIVCAARFLASAALCRYSSDRDDMQGKHWKDDSVPQIRRVLRQARRWSVGHDSAVRQVVASPGLPSPAWRVGALKGMRRGANRAHSLSPGGPSFLIAADIRIFSLAPQSSNQFASKPRTAFGRPVACRNVTVLASRFPALGPMPRRKKSQQTEC